MTTLLFVPFLYSIIGRFERVPAKRPQRQAPRDLDPSGIAVMNSMPPDPAFEASRAKAPGDRKEPPRRPKSGERRRRVIARLLGAAAVAAVAALVGFGVWSKSARNADADAVMQARLATVPTVRTIVAKADSAPRTIELTGNMAAFDSATLYARAQATSRRATPISERSSRRATCWP